MRRAPLILIPLLCLLWLIGCASEEPTDSSEAKVFQAGEVEILSLPDLPLEKAGRVDDEIFDPALFHDVEFTMRPTSRTVVRDGIFGFSASRFSVSQRTDIHGRWLGPEGYYGFDMSPHGQNFNLPVRLILDVEWILDLGLFDPERLLLLLDNEDGSFTLVPSLLLGNRMHGTLFHFSRYVIGVGPPPGGNGRD